MSAVHWKNSKLQLAGLIPRFCSLRCQTPQDTEPWTWVYRQWIQNKNHVHWMTNRNAWVVHVSFGHLSKCRSCMQQTWITAKGLMHWITNQNEWVVHVCLFGHIRKCRSRMKRKWMTATTGLMVVERISSYCPSSGGDLLGDLPTMFDNLSGSEWSTRGKTQIDMMGIKGRGARTVGGGTWDLGGMFPEYGSQRPVSGAHWPGAR